MYNPKAKHSCSVVGCTDPHVSLHRLPTKEHHQLDSTPPPPDSHNQGWTGHRAYRAMPEGPMHISGPVPPPPPPSVVGRDGLAIGRFGRFPEPPAVPPRQLSRSPPTPPPPPPPRMSVLWLPGPNLRSPVQPWSQHTPVKAHTHRRLTLTPAKNTHRRPTLTPART